MVYVYLKCDNSFLFCCDRKDLKVILGKYGLGLSDVRCEKRKLVGV